MGFDTLSLLVYGTWPTIWNSPEIKNVCQLTWQDFWPRTLPNYPQAALQWQSWTASRFCLSTIQWFETCDEKPKNKWSYCHATVITLSGNTVMWLCPHDKLQVVCHHYNTLIICKSYYASSHNIQYLRNILIMIKPNIQYIQCCGSRG